MVNSARLLDDFMENTPSEELSLSNNFGTLKREIAFFALLTKESTQINKIEEIFNRYEELGMKQEQLHVTIARILDGDYDQHFLRSGEFPSKKRVSIICQILCLYEGLTWKKLSKVYSRSDKLCAKIFNNFFYPKTKETLPFLADQLLLMLKASKCSPELQARIYSTYAEGVDVDKLLVTEEDRLKLLYNSSIKDLLDYPKNTIGDRDALIELVKKILNAEYDYLLPPLSQTNERMGVALRLWRHWHGYSRSAVLDLLQANNPDLAGSITIAKTEKGSTDTLRMRAVAEAMEFPMELFQPVKLQESLPKEGTPPQEIPLGFQKQTTHLLRLIGQKNIQMSGLRSGDIQRSFAVLYKDALEQFPDKTPLFLEKWQDAIWMELSANTMNPSALLVMPLELQLSAKTWTAWKAVIKELMEGKEPNLEMITNNKYLAEAFLSILHPAIQGDIEANLKKESPELFLTLWNKAAKNLYKRPNKVSASMFYLFAQKATEEQFRHILDTKKYFKDFFLKSVTSLEEWKDIFEHFTQETKELEGLTKRYPKLFALLDEWLEMHDEKEHFARIMGKILGKEEDHEGFFERFLASYTPEKWPSITGSHVHSGKIHFNSKSLGEIARLLNLQEVSPGYKGHIEVGLAMWPKHPWLQKIHQALSSETAKNEACKTLHRVYKRQELNPKNPNNWQQQFTFWGLTVSQFIMIFNIPYAGPFGSGKSVHQGSIKALEEYVGSLSSISSSKEA